MKHQRFLCDESARIPFSIIGVFLLIGSSLTTAYVVHLEQEKADEITSTIDFTAVDTLLRYAESDIATALNIAGLNALKEIGKKPVMMPSEDAQLQGYGETVDEINENRVKEQIKEELNIYLTATYLYDAFNDGTYAVNVVIPENVNYPLTNWEKISIRSMDLQLKRPLDIPLIGGVIGPSVTIDHQTYWVASFPITVEVRRLQKDSDSEQLTTQEISVSSILTTRYPLLKSLVDEYNQTINGAFSKLWTVTTVLSNVYTLIRGYKHYGSGEPLNVVDNRHLGPLVNGGLLLEQGLVFGSLDPLALAEFTIETGKAIKGTSKSVRDAFNETSGDGYNVTTTESSKESANQDAGDASNTSIDTAPNVNLSDIAQQVLYDTTSVTLLFQNKTTLIWANTTLSLNDGAADDISEKINEIVEARAREGYHWIGMNKDLVRNQTTSDQITQITDEMYKADFHTEVSRNPSYIFGDHIGYPIDNGTGPWMFDNYILIQTFFKPPKGFILPDCILLGKRYNVSWHQEHYWSKKTVQTSGNQTWVNWSSITTTDLNHETVTLSVVLDHYSQFLDSQKNILYDNVADVFYYNITVDDINLEDTLETYNHTYFTPHEEDQILHGSGGYDFFTIDGMIPTQWEAEAWAALEEILGLIGMIQQDPSITSLTYPNPADLIEAVKNDLLTKYTVKMEQYQNKTAYLTQTLQGMVFQSVGKKTVYGARDWYVQAVKDAIIHTFSEVADQFSDVVDKNVPGELRDHVQDALKSEVVDPLKNQFTIPFGFEMNLTRYTGSDVAWDESVRLAVDQYPNYLSAFEQTEYEGVNYWSLGLRNLCILGPTGLPILPPTPVTPWIITLNMWLIDVKGEYAEFKVIDSSDETVFHPILGHEPQIYLRKYDLIYNKNETVFFGYNSRINFSFSTVAF
ncbi:MAG: hypothetical protein NT038_00130, partial [Euryarchaeota archaeon]|nr:hypothetical protein [Euryarchaeota archaeon]